MKQNQDAAILLPINTEYSWQQRLSPLVKTMSVWGLQLGSEKQNCWSIFSFIIVHLLFAHVITFTAYIMTRDEAFIFLVHNIIYAFSAITVLVCYYRLCYYRRKLDRTLLELNHPSCAEYRTPRTEWRDHFRAAMYWLYCISYLLYSLWYFIISKNVHPYYRRYMYGLNPNSLPPSLAFTIAVVLQLGYSFWLRATEKLLCFFYSSVCRYVSSEFNCLRRCVDDLASSWHTEHSDTARDKLFSCLNRYQDLCDAVSMMDLVFSSVVVLFIASLSFQITFDSNYMCKTRGFCSNSVFCLQYFLEFIIVLISFIDLFMSASSVTIEAQEIAPSVYRIASSIETMGKDQLRPRVGLWYWKIITDPPKLTAFGAIDINRNSMISILGIIIAYVLVMYELA